ncbi:glycosyltransferase family 1 protein [Agromyces endophyticus]|uniref:glycosyltransferase family 1 protein n=1 Tax=Agromyces sp. H17E-10 TaxID=2932244 RepID=UPI001FD0B1D3|nr:glycosyltransferase family 1 protein [Agromyces sp. H17E-10]UOQ89833.1 glycosyltransferase family 1 protein [Agromyces sp. H17E-10]
MNDHRPPRKHVLILSFSPIAGDARVLKQVDLLRREYDVTTCGIGEFDREGLEHIRIPDGLAARELDGRRITLRQYRAAYRRIPAVEWTRRALAGRTFDVVLANDVESVPVALELRPADGVHADLHEYVSRLHEENPAWNRRIRPFWEWVCRRYVARASSWTTVSDGLAREYEREFGFRPEVVTNAAPYAALSPQPVASPVRLVHSGVCLRNRNLIALIDAVDRSSAALTLDLYLTPNDPAHLAELRARAADVEGVEVRDPVPYADLVATLNAYDVGVFAGPPVNFNAEWALPNKLFDFIQARLGIIVGPSVEMAAYVDRYGLGRVTSDFDADALAATFDTVTAADVAAWKGKSDAAAEPLSAERQSAPWATAIRRLTGASA